MHWRIRTIGKRCADGDIDDLAARRPHRLDQALGVGDDQRIDPVETPISHAIALGLHLRRQGAAAVAGRILHVDDHKGRAGGLRDPFGVELADIVDVDLAHGLSFSMS